MSAGAVTSGAFARAFARADGAPRSRSCATAASSSMATRRTGAASASIVSPAFAPRSTVPGRRRPARPRRLHGAGAERVTGARDGRHVPAGDRPERRAGVLWRTTEECGDDERDEILTTDVLQLLQRQRQRASRREATDSRRFNANREGGRSTAVRRTRVPRIGTGGRPFLRRLAECVVTRTATRRPFVTRRSREAVATRRDAHASADRGAIARRGGHDAPRVRDAPSRVATARCVARNRNVTVPRPGASPNVGSPPRPHESTDAPRVGPRESA